MKSHVTLALALLLSLGLIGMAVAQEVEGPRTDADAEALQRCIDDLGSESFEVREKAMATLRQAGKVALPLLESAKKHDDPEVRWRAATILKELRSDEPPVADEDQDAADAWRRAFPGFRRLKIRNLDVDGDGDPDIQIDFPDIDRLRRQMVRDREEIMEQLDRGPGLRLREFRFPQLDLDVRNDGATGFRMATRPDGTVKMEKLRNGRWVPIGDDGRRAYGMTLGTPGDALRAQLGIPEGAGLVVEGLDEDGAGAKAGLEMYDIILTVRGENVTGVSDFEERVGETPEGKDALLQVYRKAQKVEISLPVQRVRRF